MSLETVIQENTDTMKKLIACWNALTSQAKVVQADIDTGEPVTILAGGVKVAVVQAVEAPKPAATPTVPATATPTPPVEAAAPTAAVASPSEPVSYEQVAAAITATVKVDRAKVVATLGKFGAAKGTMLKPEQYADFLKELA